MMVLERLLIFALNETNYRTSEETNTGTNETYNVYQVAVSAEALGEVRRGVGCALVYSIYAEVCNTCPNNAGVLEASIASERLKT